jgi:hypothetical protein
MNGLLPETIESDRLQEANALLGGAQSVSNILGPVIAGILIAVFDPGGAILLDAATFVVSIGFLLRIGAGALGAGGDAEEGFLEQLRGGWREVRSRTWVWTGLIALAAYHVIVLPAVFVLGPILAHRELEGASDWALIVTGFGVGSVAGQVLIYRVKFKRPLRASFIGFVVASSQAAIIGSGLPVGAIAALEAVTGMAVSMAFTLWEMSLQQHIPSRALSRVSSYDFTASAGLMPIGLALAGPIADAVGLHATLRLMSVIGMASALACLAVPAVRELAGPEERGRSRDAFDLARADE